MIYIKEINDFKNALALDKSQVTKIQGAIEKAYHQQWHKDGPNIDQINAIVAPVIDTPEEAFYAATVILSDVFGAMNSLKK